MSINHPSPNPCPALPLPAYAILFAGFLYLAWIAAWLLYQCLNAHFTWMTGSGARFTYWLAMKLVLWILPSLYLIRLSGKTFREIMACHQTREILRWGAGTGLLLALISILVRMILHQPLLSIHLSWALIGGAIVSPIVEEITFRGAILNALQHRYAFWRANLITGILFIAIHFPGWYFQGRLMINLATPIGGAFSIFLLGLLFGYVAHRSRSVAASTLCHMLNNFFS